MLRRIGIAFVVLAVTTIARAEVSVVVELVPDNPGPYIGGESLTVDVWLHSQVAEDVRLNGIQFDFTDTDSGLSLDPAFTFDFGDIPDHANHYLLGFHSPELPVPVTINGIDCFCPTDFLLLSAGGSLHIGSIGVGLPVSVGTYRLDTFNVDEPEPSGGATLGLNYTSLGPVWRAFTGELTDGQFDFEVTPAVPTISEVGLLVMSLLLLLFGGKIIARRTQTMTVTVPPSGSGCSHVARLALPIGLLLSSSGPALGESGLVWTETVTVSIDSGIVHATGGGTDPEVVYAENIAVSGATWMRLHFEQVQLSGSSTTGNASFLRITSVENGAVQVLDSAALDDWGYTTSSFSGMEVTLELLAYPNTGANRVVVDAIAVDAQGSGGSAASICGNDDRVPSSDVRVGRFRFRSNIDGCSISKVCTAFLFNDRPRSLLTAGHCCHDTNLNCTFSPYVEFNVELSDPNGSVNPGYPNPPSDPSDVFPVDVDTIHPLGHSQGWGSDWCYLGVFNNDEGETPLERYGQSYRLAKAVPPGDGSSLSMSGHGADLSPPEHNFVQQIGTGPFVELDGTRVLHLIDTTGGTSGAAIEQECEDVVYAIHTTGLCHLGQYGYNLGTAITNPNLQDALIPNYIDGGTRQPTGVCADCNDNGISDLCDTDCGAPGCGTPCGASADCNVNGVPDECEPNEDCQPNGTWDICDVYSGTSVDLNGNLIPDECESDVGACCRANAVCAPYRDDCCTNAGDLFLGDGISCSPTGGCCVGGSTCTMTPEACCDNAGASFSATDTCDTGACCMGQGVCQELPEACCGNLFLGSGVSCPGGIITGRCCLPPHGCCVNSGRSWCRARGGVYHDGEDCGFPFGCEGTQGPVYGGP